MSLGTGFLIQGFLAVSGPFAARVLGVEDRGYLALLIILPSVMWQIGTMGLPFALPFFLAREQGHERSILRRVRGTVIVQTLALVALHAVIVFAIAAGEPEHVLTASAVSLVILPGIMLLQYALAVLQGLRSFLFFNVFRVAPVALYALALIVIFVTGGADLWVVVLTFGVSYGVATLAAAITVRRELARKQDDAGEAKSDLRDMMKFGVKSFLGSAPPVESFRIDQMVVGFFLSPAALGLYVVAIAFTNILGFIAKSVGAVAYPALAAERDPVLAKRTMWRYFWLSAGLSLTFAIALSLTADLLVRFFFGSDFVGAVPLVRILLFGTLLASIRRVLADCMKGLGYPGGGSIAEITSLVGLFGALIFFLPMWGVDGVAWSLAVAGALSLAVIVGFAIKARPERPSDDAGPVDDGLGAPMEQQA
jgi:O-antigen/teichoic acid export membrane protein